MAYQVARFFIKTFLFIFYKKQIVINKELLLQKGPLLIVTNHPNAFIDAIVIGCLFKNPIHFITRGDVFKKKSTASFLSKLNMIPIYRIRDGIENLALNDFAFIKSKEVLQNNGIVMIFIEGICKHTHQLQPLKKGAARIALNCFKENIPLQILPASIRYSSLFSMPINIEVSIGNLLQKNELVNLSATDAINYHQFNAVIENCLENLLSEKQNKNQNATKYESLSFLKYISFPFLSLIEKFVFNKTKNTVFYHSFLFAAIVILFPLYLATFGVLLCLLGVSTKIILLLIFSKILLYILSIKR